MADGMLGRLCRWMRLLGYDVTYAGSEKEDAEILRECESRGLFLLTRDRELSRRYRESMYLESDDWRRQLAQVMAAFPPERSAMFTRCPLCNSSLVAVGNGEVSSLVPDGVLERHDRFYRCTGCGKVYWEGSHFRNIKGEIDRLRGTDEDHRQ
ncbi:Mut7-C RNAse domain-containing protein [Thermogymnomonas acidicola]|nr:Mut7-C RNAse domain-containing protein [Thermogymnomonas acidicola]